MNVTQVCAHTDIIQLYMFTFNLIVSDSIIYADIVMEICVATHDKVYGSHNANRQVFICTLYFVPETAGAPCDLYLPT